MEIQTPSSVTTPIIDENIETVTVTRSPDPNSDVPITVEDMLNITPAETRSPLNISVVPDQAPVSPIKSPMTSTNNTSTAVFNISEGVTSFPDGSDTAAPTTDAQPVKTPSNSLTERINECIDNAQNMKIACTDNSSAPSKA